MLVHLARAHGVEDVVLPKVNAYVEAASLEQPHLDLFAEKHAAVERAYHDLLTTLSRLPPGEVRSSLLATTQELLRAHDNRLSLANDMTPPLKWLSIVIFGLLTQIALLLVHPGDRRAARVAVGLFTVALSFCLLVVAFCDAPFEVVLRHKPAQTPKLAL